MYEQLISNLEIKIHKKIRWIHIKKRSEDCVIYEFETEYEGYYLKEPLNDDKTQKLEREVVLLERILNSCPVFYTEKVSRLELDNGKVYFLQKRIEGVTLTQLDGVTELSVINAIIDSLIKLSNIQIEKNIDWKKYLLNNLLEFVSKIENGNFGDKLSVIEFINRLSEKIAEKSFDNKICILHNDLNSDNIIILSNNDVCRAFLIDFEHSILGDPLKELSKLAWFLRKNTMFRQCFIHRYEEKIGVIDFKLLKLYIGYDIAYHISRYDELIHDKVWEEYFKEEYEIILRFWEEDNNLW